MTPEIIKACERTARKRHVCSYCGAWIEPGEKYEFATLKWEGEVYDWRTHKECDFVASELWSYIDPDEGMTEEDFHNGCQNFCQCFICPDCDRFDKDEEGCLDDSIYCIHKIYEVLQKYMLVRSRDKYGYFCYKLKGREEP